MVTERIHPNRMIARKCGFWKKNEMFSISSKRYFIFLFQVRFLHCFRILLLLLLFGMVADAFADINDPVMTWAEKKTSNGIDRNKVKACIRHRQENGEYIYSKYHFLYYKDEEAYTRNGENCHCQSQWWNHAPLLSAYPNGKTHSIIYCGKSNVLPPNMQMF